MMMRHRRKHSRAYGVTWDESTNPSSGVRVGQGASAAVSSTLPANLAVVQSLIRRCVINNAGAVQYYLDAANSTLKENGDPANLDGTDGQVMVEIPQLWLKYNYANNNHTWIISKEQFNGAERLDAFYKNGVWVGNRYLGAYEGSMWDASAGGGAGAMVPAANITDNMYAAGDKLCSYSGEFPKTNETRGEFRGMATSRGSGWRQQDYDLISAVQLLYLVEYADFNSQSMIGMGRTELAGGSWAADSYIGQCGKSNGDGNGTNSVAGNTNNAYMTYRGIENFFGDVWKWVDGINIGGAASPADDHKVHVCNDDSDFADNTWTNYTDLSVVIAGGNGWQNTLEQISRGFLPASVGGGAGSTTKITDYYYQYTGWRVVGLGGDARFGASAGAFCVHASSAASIDIVNVGGRLAY